MVAIIWKGLMMVGWGNSHGWIDETGRMSDALKGSHVRPGIPRSVVGLLGIEKGVSPQE